MFTVDQAQAFHRQGHHGSMGTAELRHGSCRLCSAQLKATFVNLGMSPLCESFLRGNQIDEMEPYYPLHALVCGECFLVQLQGYVAPERIFSEYAYFSSYSTSWVNHARRYCEMMIARFGLSSSSQVFEIASNDGYLLQHFLRFGVPILGIEPAANVAEAARRRQVPTLVEFFGLQLARRLVSEGHRADLIVGNNVLAQVPDLHDFTEGMAHLLAPTGVITLEFPHLERLIEDNQFDTIYHEHFSYFSLIAIERLAKHHRLRIFDVEQLASHGGSLRVYLCHLHSIHVTSQRASALLAHERAIGFENLKTYERFAGNVHETKRQLLSFLIAAKKAGAKICGYGAPGKGNTLLNYCGIGTDFLEFTVDRNPYKHGRYTPGMRIPIYPVSAIDEARPDYLLVLPWNLTNEIVVQMRRVGTWGCKMIVPIPEVKVIDPGDMA